GHRRRLAGGRGVPRIAQAAAGAAAAAGEADPAAPLLRQHDAVADRPGAGHLADARLPAAGPHPGAAAPGADHRRLTEAAEGAAPDRDRGPGPPLRSPAGSTRVSPGSSPRPGRPPRG